MFCSIVIPTIGRSTLARAVNSVLEQSLPESDFEVIVVNDSGRNLPDEDWLQSPKITIINTYKRERCFARNTGAAVAAGDYVGFLDDDDWLLPGALLHFSDLARRHPQAVWLYGGIRVVDDAGATLGEVNSGMSGNCLAQMLGGAWAPLQSSLIQTSAFFQAGGFTPSISVTEDLDLSRRVAFLGGFSNTPHTIACLFRGKNWETSTNYIGAETDTKFSRDRILNKKGVFRRLLSSVRSSHNVNYWSGRVARVYLSTIGFNLHRRRVFTALSRAVFALAWFLLNMGAIFSKDFWLAVRAHHVPETLHFIMEAYERKNRAHPTLHLSP